MVWMHHVEIAAKTINAAANYPPLANRQILQQPIIARIEEHQIDESGAVATADPVRLALMTRLLMPFNLDFQGDDGAILDRGQTGTIPPVDNADRVVPEQINHMGAAEPFSQLREPRAKTRQLFQWRKEREEDGWSHSSPNISYAMAAVVDYCRNSSFLALTATQEKEFHATWRMTSKITANG
jgi:hypothetical protein